MSKHARDHAHCGDQPVQKRAHPNQSGRGPIHTPPDQAGFTRTNSTVFNPKILEASIKEIASLLEDGEKADLLLYAAKKLDVSREKWVLFPCELLAGRPSRAHSITPTLPSLKPPDLACFTVAPAFFQSSSPIRARGRDPTNSVQFIFRFTFVCRAWCHFQRCSPSI